MTLYLPTDTAWETEDPAAEGWNAAGLREVVEFARGSHSSAFLMIQNGRILTEDYWAPTMHDLPEPVQRGYGNMRRDILASGQPVEDVASLQKSVTAVLTAIARQKGMLDYGDRFGSYLGEGWSKTSPELEDAITIRHVMSMTSGLSDQLEFEAEHGEQWRYNTSVYQRLVRAIGAAAGTHFEQITREWLTGRIGMYDTRWISRVWSDDPNLLGLSTTARDLGRFGLLVLNGGRWGKEEIVDMDLLEELLQPSQSYNPAYGLLWWLNDSEIHQLPANPDAVEGPLIPSAPRDMVAGLGALDRKLYVVPSQRLVIVRMGALGAASMEQSRSTFDDALWLRLKEAMS
ncbi:MAG: serine hydrolase [Gammaproteobacteria bacterium]|nr:serine hydrolase [Gammaproteobacteria bacterium]